MILTLLETHQFIHFVTRSQAIAMMSIQTNFGEESAIHLLH